jgi:hypothetical protein
LKIQWRRQVPLNVTSPDSSYKPAQNAWNFLRSK